MEDERRVVKRPPQYVMVKNSGSVPAGAVQVARQNDKHAKHWTAVAHTLWGDLPGKTSDFENTCWYAYESDEWKTDNFSWLTSSSSEIVLMMNDGKGPPSTALKIGNLNNVGDMFAAIAVSDVLGSVPGRALGSTCWYSYGGNEITSSNFYWVCTMFNLVKHEGWVPGDAVKLAWENNCVEGWYSAVAHTSWGDIPGKAKRGTCWYSYYGKERRTDTFSYVVVPPNGAALISHSSGTPEGALRIGHEINKDGGMYPMYAAVAFTDDWGTIPGKASGNDCWYSYEGNEYHTTKHFAWVKCLCDSYTLDQEKILKTNQSSLPLVSIPHDYHRVDEFVFNPCEKSSHLKSADVLHVREAATVLISRWNITRAELNRGPSGSTIDRVSICRSTVVTMENNGDVIQRGTRFANVEIQTGNDAVASVFINIGVDFVPYLIRRALSISLDKSVVIMVRKRESDTDVMEKSFDVCE